MPVGTPVKGTAVATGAVGATLAAPGAPAGMSGQGVLLQIYHCRTDQTYTDPASWTRLLFHANGTVAKTLVIAREYSDGSSAATTTCDRGGTLGATIHVAVWVPGAILAGYLTSSAGAAGGANIAFGAGISSVPSGALVLALGTKDNDFTGTAGTGSVPDSSSACSVMGTHSGLTWAELYEFETGLSTDTAGVCDYATTSSTTTVGTSGSITSSGITNNTASYLALAETTPQTLSPTGIASTSAVGSPALSHEAAQTLSPTGIASASAVGQPALSHIATQTLSPTGIPPAGGVGQPALIAATNQTLSPTGIAATGGVGTPALVPALDIEPPVPSVERGRMLEAQICDVLGEPLADAVIHHTTEGGGLQVTDPLNDSRTARLVLSLEDPSCKKVRPLDRILSVTYGGYLIFKGPILQPRFDFEAGTVEIYAHDMTIRLKHHYHKGGDPAVDDGYPIDGTGMRTLVRSARPSPAQLDRDTPGHGILWGNDTSTTQGPKPADPENPAPGDGIWRTASPGDNVWESITNLAQALLGPDFRFRPVDRHHPGVNGYPDPGDMCELDTADELGSDKSDTVYFEHNLGLDNASNVTWEPDGDVVRNWARFVTPGGDRDSEQRKATYQANGSMTDYGIYQSWESSGQEGDSKKVLEEKAKAQVTAYKRPPDFIGVTPRIERGQGVFDYQRDYKVGDKIRIRARKGFREIDEVARIIGATIASVDQSGNAQVSLECVPVILEAVDPED